jgi:SAM-dependent methyltransferase
VTEKCDRADLGILLGANEFCSTGQGVSVSVKEMATRLKSASRLVWTDRTLTGMAEALTGAVALEPGGPSASFGRRGLVPVYSRLAALDILDYAERTLWSSSGSARVPSRCRLIGEAGKLHEVPDSSYDAVLASHVVEHLANPLGALAEWQRVLRPGGYMLLIVPHRDGTFDHRRPVTSLEHLQADAVSEAGEDDLTHLEEILELHDLARDPGAPSREVFERRCRENQSSRAMHHHVFITRTAVDMCRAADLDVLSVRPVRPFNIVCFCRVGQPQQGELGEWQLSEILRRSPFASDRGS